MSDNIAAFGGWVLPGNTPACPQHVDGCPPELTRHGWCGGPRRPHHTPTSDDITLCAWCDTDLLMPGDPTPTVNVRYIPAGRPPTGQYRVSLFITGDDHGPAALAWVLRHLVNTLGMIGYVEHIDTVRQGDTKYDDPPPAPHTPDRRSDVAAWLKSYRDQYDRDTTAGRPMWDVLDGLLNDYRDRADTGTPLTGPAPEVGP